MSHPIVLIMGDTGPVFRAYDNSTAPEVVVSNGFLPSSPAITSQVDGDLQLTKTSESGARPQYLLTISSQTSVELTNLNPELFDMDGTVVTAKAAVSGLGGVLITPEAGAIVRRDLSSATLGASFYYRVDSLTEGSFLDVATAPVLAARTASSQSAAYSINHAGAGAYSRRPDCWGAAYDLSAVAVANNVSGSWSTQRGLTMISPRHGLAAEHFGFVAGKKARFLNESTGQTVESTVLRTLNVWGDVQLVLLDSDTGIEPMPVMFNWHDSAIYQRGLDGGTYHIHPLWGLLGFTITGNSKELTPQLICPFYAPSSLATNVGTFSDRTASVSINSYLYEESVPFLAEIAGVYSVAAGDSGSPIMALVNNTPVLVTHWFSTGAGPNYAGQADVLDAAIAAIDAAQGISTGYTVTEAEDPTA